MKARRRQPRGTSRRRQLGIALLVVLLLVVLLEVIIGDLAIYGWISYKGARNASRSLAQVAAVDGAMRLVAKGLADQDFRDRFLPEVLATGVNGLVLGETEVSVTVEDEGAKWNANLLGDPDAALVQVAQEELLALFEALGENRGLAEGILRFFADAVAGEGEQEQVTAHVLSLLGELRLVEGVTEEVLWGQTGAAAGGPRPGAGARQPDAGAKPGLSRYLTCWGDGMVNVNTASREVLAAVVGTVRPDLADAIIAQRARAPILSVAEIDGFAGLPEPQRQRLTQRLAAQSDAYQLTISCRTADLVTVSRAVLAGDPDTGVQVLFCQRVR
jgi:type II secretory pathway component PulK